MESDPQNQKASFYLGVALDRKGLKHEARQAYRSADPGRGGNPAR
jgi:Flp pilus assembly protein TadD